MFMDCSRWQGTFGKVIARIKVTDINGQRITLGRSVKRNLGKLIGTLPLFIGMFWILFDKRKQALHDKFARTVVIQRTDGF